MEITRELSVPASFVFKKMMDSVKHDIEQATGEQVQVNQMENFTYIKEFTNKSTAKIKIEKVEQNQSYHYITSTTRNDFEARYEIREINEKKCEVHYTEKMQSHGRVQQMNDLTVALLLGYFKKRQFNAMLTALESEY